MVLRCHDDPPEVATREALRLLDEEPVLDAELLALGRWIAEYYCAPLGEVLRAMMPLAGEIRRGKVYSLTDAGRDAARQLLLDARARRSGGARSCACSKARPLSAAYLTQKVPLADKASPVARSARASSSRRTCRRSAIRCARLAERLRVELAGADGRPASCPRPSASCCAYLELHPGLAQSDGSRGSGRERQHGGPRAGPQGNLVTLRRRASGLPSASARSARRTR